ncbi:hypothetical protein HY637_04615 [Candidatus Woesearchaeota archaeon]|nr:hypothetical protein [Candidatus Woesearchaeota archaeon]
MARHSPLLAHGNSPDYILTRRISVSGLEYRVFESKEPLGDVAEFDYAVGTPSAALYARRASICDERRFRQAVSRGEIGLFRFDDAARYLREHRNFRQICLHLVLEIHSLAQIRA